MSVGSWPQRVVVTGLGQVAPHGRDVPAAFEALLNGRSALACHEVGEAPHSVTLPSAICPGFDAAAELGRARVLTMDRVSQLSALPQLRHGPMPAWPLMAPRARPSASASALA